MGHEQHDREALALDALGALDASERQSLDAQLSTCPDCRREHDELRRTAALLAYDAAPVAPPRHLRSRLLERISEEGTGARLTETASEVQTTRAQVSEVQTTGAQTSEVQATRAQADIDARATSEVQTTRAESEGETGRVLRPSPERFTRGKSSAWARALAYGALAASVVLAVSLFLVLREARATRAASERLAAQLKDEREELTRAREELARRREELAREREMAELLTAPGVRMTSLAGTPDMPGARASLAYDRASGRAVIFASGLPAPPAGKAYQMWYIAGGKVLPGGVFKSDTSGRAYMTDQAPPEGRDAAGFAVTLEPETGVPVATGSILLKSAS